MTNSYRPICAALAITLGLAIAQPAPSFAQETVIEDVVQDVEEPASEEMDGTEGIVGEDVSITWDEDGTPMVEVAVPATVFMPFDTEEELEMHLLLQEELNRLGCDAGPVDGDWGRRSEQAMDRLREAVPDIHDIELSLTLAGLMKKMPEGTCPLVCSVREVRVENRCELKTCPSGQYLDSRGTCRVRQARASKPRASGGGGGGGGGGRNCVTYNARTYCN